MVRKSTLAVVILFLLLLAAALYLQRNPLPAAENNITPTPTEQAKLLPEVATADITSMRMAQGAAEPVQAVLDPSGAWIIDQETGLASTSPGKIEQARDELASALVTASLPADYSLEAVGLAQPGTEITLSTSSGKQYVIRVGDETPTGGGMYVQVDNSVPVVINSAVIETVTALLVEATAPVEVIETPAVTPVP